MAAETSVYLKLDEAHVTEHTDTNNPGHTNENHGHKAGDSASKTPV